MAARSLKNKRILITGVAGFGGSWLAETILNNEKNVEVFGLKRHTNFTKNIDHIKEKLHIFDADIVSENILDDVIKKVDPQIVFHLAAKVPGAGVVENREEIINTNVYGTKNLLESLAKNATDLQIFHFASTSNVYKKVSSTILIKEDDPTDPRDAYSESKIKAENICRDFFEDRGIPIVITRSFNQMGIRSLENLVASKIAKIAAIAKKEGQREFVFGNINAVRDFTDVRDIVLGYLLTAKKGRVGEVYNLCSGKGTKIKDMISMALDYVGLDNMVKIISDKRLFRKTEPDTIIGDNTKARNELGWKPKIPFEQTLKEMIDNYLSAN
jgi:GDP-mannose 4,6-dehydratase